VALFGGTAGCVQGDDGPAVEFVATARTSVEGFESGSKQAYAVDDVAIDTGTWNMDDALIGSLDTDVKTGTKAARTRNSGRITMDFDRTTGAGTVSIHHAKFNLDDSSTWALFQSRDHGTTWSQVGATVTTSTTTFATATFTVNVAGTVRFSIRKLDGTANRIDFDDISITDFAAGPVFAPGDPLPGTDPVQFAAALANFAAPEEIADGLGPTFNEAACGNCHTTPVIGGSGLQVERRFGQITNGVFFAFDRDPNNFGGTLRQLFSNGTFANGTMSCTIPFDAEAPTANIHNVGRRTVPLFGLGLVDAMPDSWFDSLAANEPAATRGTVLRSIPNFPDSRDSSQSLTRTRVRRFGLKDQQTNLVSFAGDAYNNEMGITTQSCYKGTAILAFAFENLPSGAILPVACNGGDLKPANPPGNPNIPQFTDDAVGSCAGGLDEVQDDMANFLFFMEHLAPPSQVLTDPQATSTGGALFQSTGCASCHTSGAFTTPANPFNGVPGSMQFFPFSDFLVHDMGSLGDGIGETGDSLATTRQMRTAPLWGARFNTQFLHDGRAKSIGDAILAHDGQGLTARNSYSRLDATSQSLIVRFINTL
jgi:hypothetical protein